MNFKNVFANILQGASSGAVQGLQSQEGPKVNWQTVGIVAIFGALVGLTHALTPAAPAAVPATPPAAQPAA